MIAQELAERWAAMSPAAWLAGAAGPRRHDIVIRWGWDPGWLAPLPCGVRWDALALGHDLASAAFKALRATDARGALGPVLHDQSADLTYWLLPVEAGASDWWRDIDSSAQLLTAGTPLYAPDPAPETPQPPFPVCWIHWPSITGPLTPPHLLAAALKAAAGT